MTAIIESWPWFDRLIVGVMIAMILCAPYFILRKLDEILRLLRKNYPPK